MQSQWSIGEHTKTHSHTQTVAVFADRGVDANDGLLMMDVTWLCNVDDADENDDGDDGKKKFNECNYTPRSRKAHFYDRTVALIG